MTDRPTAATITNEQLVELYADLDHYEEHIVGDLNEKNISLARRAGLAEAALDRVRAALASFKGRGVLSIGHVNLDIPTAGEVLDAVRAALDGRPGPAQPCTGECDPTSGAYTHTATCYDDRERTGRNAGLVFPAMPAPVPCPACRRADQAGLAPTELHDDCAKEQR